MCPRCEHNSIGFKLEVAICDLKFLNVAVGKFVRNNCKEYTMELEQMLSRGNIYRMPELEAITKLNKRALQKLVVDGSLDKITSELYYFPKLSVFGKVPPEDHVILSLYLNHQPFLITTLNHYNGLGIGTTQLYNSTLVYNGQISGKRKVGRKVYHFKKKNDFPKELTPEYLYVDVVNNLKFLEEDREQVLSRVKLKIGQLENQKFTDILNKYGTEKTKRLLKNPNDL